MSRDDLKGRLPVVYNGKTVEEWYQLFCQESSRVITQREVMKKAASVLESYGGHSKLVAKLRGETDELA